MKAAEAKVYHSRLFPDYTYTPRRPGEVVRRVRRFDDEDSDDTTDPYDRDEHFTSEMRAIQAQIQAHMNGATLNDIALPILNV